MNKTQLKDKYILALDTYNQIEKFTNYPIDLLFHSDILDKYGLFSNVMYASEMEIKEWVESQSDNGMLYYKLYQEIYTDEHLEELQKILYNKEQEIESEYFANFKEIIENIKIYKASIKNKKAKALLKDIGMNLTIAIKENNISYHHYLQEKFNIQLILDIERDIKSVRPDFDDKIKEYKGIKENIELQEKFYINQKNNLRENVIQYILDKNKYDKYKEEKVVSVEWDELSEEDRALKVKAYIDKEFHTNIDIQSCKIESKYVKWNKKYHKLNRVYATLNKNNDIVFEIPEKTKKKSNKTFFTKENMIKINEKCLEYIVKKHEEMTLDDLIKTFPNFVEELKEVLYLKRILKNDTILIKENFIKMCNDIYNL